MKSLRFFFDRCCPPRLAQVIGAFEEREVRHFNRDDRLLSNEPDISWLRILADDADTRWVVVSMDGQILKRKHEKLALTESKLHFFLLGSAWMKMDLHHQSWQLLKVWPELVRFAEQRRDLIFEIKAGSSLKIEPR